VRTSRGRVTPGVNAREKGGVKGRESRQLGHRIEVNEGSYETPMGFEFMRQRMGSSMAQAAKELCAAGPVLVQFPISAIAEARK